MSVSKGFGQCFLVLVSSDFSPAFTELIFHTILQVVI